MLGCRLATQSTADRGLEAEDYFVRLTSTAEQGPVDPGAQGFCGQRSGCGLSKGEAAAATGHAWLTEMKDAALPAKPELVVRQVEQADSRAVFELSCGRVVPLVAFEAFPVLGTFSDNLVTCLPGEPRTYSFTGTQPFAADKFREHFEATALTLEGSVKLS